MHTVKNKSLKNFCKFLAVSPSFFISSLALYEISKPLLNFLSSSKTSFSFLLPLDNSFLNFAGSFLISSFPLAFLPYKSGLLNNSSFAAKPKPEISVAQSSKYFFNTLLLDAVHPSGFSHLVYFLFLVSLLKIFTPSVTFVPKKKFARPLLNSVNKVSSFAGFL